MTATIISHDVALLCAAIDSGDDGALPILADALEEAGDARAEGLRVPGIGRAKPGLDGIMPRAGQVEWSGANCRWIVFGPGTRCYPGPGTSDHPTRSAALLALAAALTEESP